VDRQWDDEEHRRVSDVLSEAAPIKARHIRPGQGQAVEVKTGQYLQIQTLQGKQVADFIAFVRDDREEYLSTSVTQATNHNIVPKKGMTLYSNRRQGMFEIVEDTVGRHDMLYACCDPIRYEMLDSPGHANCREAMTDALASYGIGYDRIPTPINWFQNVAILQRGELDIREPLAEADDFVLLRALKDVIAAVSACPMDLTPTNGFAPTDIRIRVFPEHTQLVTEPAPDASARAKPASAASGDATTERAARRAERRAARRTAAVEEAVEERPDGVETREETEVEDAAAQSGASPSGDSTGAGAENAPAAPTLGRTPRPARLGDTAQATVVRVGPSAEAP
jgi:uncharacterized protein YcgI (DUF1989 family)